FHVEQQTAKNIRAGMSPAEARRQALVTFGGVEPFKERVRDQFRLASLVRDFGRDLRIGARLLARAPGFATSVILTLALGIAAATTVFSIVDGVLLRPLPYPESDRIVRLYEVKGASQSNLSALNLFDWRARTTSFSSLAQVQTLGLAAVLGGPEPMRV